MERVEYLIRATKTLDDSLTDIFNCFPAVRPLSLPYHHSKDSRELNQKIEVIQIKSADTDVGADFHTFPLTSIVVLHHHYRDYCGQHQHHNNEYMHVYNVFIQTYRIIVSVHKSVTLRSHYTQIYSLTANSTDKL
uniref:Uncharacterized protein n=1 Tax=Glossina pallidipes TaxID=7398 RepID=A0A1B0A902_GLOPL